MANGWTEERRKRQSELIQNWQPWKSSTGPKTSIGKSKASQNAFKGGFRPQLRKLAKALRNQQLLLDELSIDELSAMADLLADAAFHGNSWAIQQLASVE